MIDENAYGILVSYFDIEEDEYGLEIESFAERVSAFGAILRGCLRDGALGAQVRAVALGHAFYFELAEDELGGDPLAFIREARRRLSDEGFESVGVLTHGGRWLEAEAQASEPSPLMEVCLPSEPLRHALDADAASRATEDDEPSGWGPGLYVEDEAIEALGRKLKNEPTALEAGGARFFRISR
jgi:hypothetical protein